MNIQKVISNQVVLLNLIIGLLAILTFSNLLSWSSNTYFFASLMLLSPTIYFYSKKGIDLFSPLYLFLAAFFLYSVAGGKYIEINGTERTGGIIEKDTLSRYYFTCILALLSFAQGIIIARYKGFKKVRFKAINQYLNPYYLIAFAITIALPFINRLYSKFDFINAKPYRTNSLVSRLEFKENTAQGIIDVIFVIGPLSCIIFAITILFFSKKSSVIIKFISLSIFGVAIFTALKSGLRGQIVSMALIPIIYYHYQVKKIKLGAGGMIMVLLSAITLYMFMRSLEVMRVQIEVQDFISFFLKEFDRVGWELFALSNVGELLTSTNQMVLMQSISEGHTDLSYGATFLNDILSFIPRAIYPDRPLPLSEYFAFSFYHEFWKQGGGFGLFITMESFWAFGYLGVYFYFIAFGYILQQGYIYLTHNSSKIRTFIYIQFFMVFVAYSTRSGILLSIKGFLMAILTFMLFVVLNQYFSKRINY